MLIYLKVLLIDRKILRTAIVGDIGGQIGVFHEVITSLGGDIKTGKLPAGLRVIQVGDIIRVNPSPELDSLACAQFADKLIEANDGNYIQLLGNHETPLLGGIFHPEWHETDLDACVPIIESWWDDRKAHLSALLMAPGATDTLVTHAGLTKGYMERIGATSAIDAARILNGYVGNVSLGGIERPGGLVTGVQDKSSDIFWALVGSELHESWWEEGAGFNQVHGHSCLFRWDVKEYWHDVNESVQKRTMVNTNDRFTMTIHPNGDWYRSVDWVLGNTKQKKEWPILILNNFDVYLGD
jgi:hypothetical protein